LRRLVPGIGHQAQTDAARGARGELDDALAGKRLQVFLGCVGGAEAELRGDFRPRGREAGVGDVLPVQGEDFLLSCGELALRADL